MILAERTFVITGYSEAFITIYSVPVTTDVIAYDVGSFLNTEHISLGSCRLHILYQIPLFFIVHF